MTASPWWLPLAALAVDAAVGDPRWLPHPVTLMGLAITRLETRLRRSGMPLRAAGAVLALAMVGGAWGLTRWLLVLAGRVHPWFGTALEVWLLATALAPRSLAEHALAVYRPLRSSDLAEARRSLGRIVGRDTAQLDEAEIVRGTVESVAESTCDGVIAPLFWGLIGGAPLAMAYKAANTLDSMVGHLDDRYREFGWASARLDDLLNLAPARLSALLLAAVAGSGRAWRIALRDAHLHPSPNSGWPEAAMAGALGVQLGGVNDYGGEPEERARLGDPHRSLETADVLRAVRLMYLSTMMAVAAGTLLLWRLA